MFELEEVNIPVLVGFEVEPNPPKVVVGCVFCWPKPPPPLPKNDMVGVVFICVE